MDYLREPLDPPNFASLDNAMQNSLRTASASLPDLAPLTGAAVADAPDECFTPLRHALSEHYVALNRPKPMARRSPMEMAALDRLEAQPQQLGRSSYEVFLARLEDLNRRLTNGAGGWRTSPIRLSGDRAGNQVYFPPVAAIEGQLQKMRAVLAGEDDRPPLFRGVVAYALLLNAHPFSDGNGRTARVMLNYVLRRGGMPANVYLPLYEIAHRAMGGHDIVLRTAELRGDWEPLFTYFLNVLQCCRNIAGRPVHRDLHAHG